MLQSLRKWWSITWKQLCCDHEYEDLYMDDYRYIVKCPKCGHKVYHGERV